MKIYTRKGDSGEASLFGGERVSKDSLRLEAYGTTDELNSFLGLARSYRDGVDQEIDNMLDEIINPMQENTDVKPNNFDMVFEKQLKYNKWILV